MKRVGELYEVVVFTASVSKVNNQFQSFYCTDVDQKQYGDPLLDQLDIHGVVHHRLFRESCYNHQGNYVKVSGMLVVKSGSQWLMARTGSVPGWPRSQGNNHHRQLADIVHLSPSARGTHQQLVLGRARQRAARFDTCAGRPGQLASKRRQSRPRCRTLVRLVFVASVACARLCLDARHVATVLQTRLAIGILHASQLSH